MTTPNDKLPEEIRKQINYEATTKTAFREDRDCTPISKGQFYGYIAGATAWAPWKVKHDELQTQAQCMADALELLVSRFEGAAEMANQDIDSGIMKDCKKLLQQFKDGGKEEEPVKEIEYMPVHPEDARKPDCPKQFPMHLLSEDQAQSNHGQTLKRLKERGGLSVREILAIVGEKKWNYYGGLQWSEAIKMLNDILTSPTK